MKKKFFYENDGKLGKNQFFEVLASLSYGFWCKNHMLLWTLFDFFSQTND